MSSRFAPSTLFYAGMGIALVLVVGGLAWPEARALGLGLGALIAFLGMASSALLARLAVEPPKNDALETVLAALRESLTALPTQLEKPLQKGQSELNAKLTQELQAMAVQLQAGLTEGLKAQGTQLGAALAVDWKASTQDLQQTLASLRQQAQSASEEQAKVQASALQASRQAFAQQVSELAQQARKEREADVQALRGEWQGLTQKLQVLTSSLEKSGQEQAEAGRAERQATVTALAAAAQAWVEKSVVWQSDLEASLSSRLSQGAEALLQVHRDGLKNSTEVMSMAVNQAQGVLEAQAQSLTAMSEAAREALQETSEATGKSLLAAGASLAEVTASHRDLATATGKDIQALASSSSEILAEQAQGVREAVAAVAALAGETAKAQQALAQLENVAQVNQVELQAGIAMLNSALGNLLDRLEGQAQAGESQEAFLGKLEAALAAYQERAGDILSENALKTQEILMEALQVLEARPSALAAAESGV